MKAKILSTNCSIKEAIDRALAGNTDPYDGEAEPHALTTDSEDMQTIREAIAELHRLGLTERQKQLLAETIDAFTRMQCRASGG
jgi:hypothetical protein